MDYTSLSLADVRAALGAVAPTTTRRFTAPPNARPSASDIPADVVRRFIDQQREGVTRVSALDDARAASAIMTSPFAKAITYSVLDGWRLVVAHEHRHVQQAKRVMAESGFPEEV